MEQSWGRSDLRWRNEPVHVRSAAQGDTVPCPADDLVLDQLDPLCTTGDLDASRGLEGIEGNESEHGDHPDEIDEHPEVGQVGVDEGWIRTGFRWIRVFHIRRDLPLRGTGVGGDHGYGILFDENVLR